MTKDQPRSITDAEWEIIQNCGTLKLCDVTIERLSNNFSNSAIFYKIGINYPASGTSIFYKLSLSDKIIYIKGKPTIVDFIEIIISLGKGDNIRCRGFYDTIFNIHDSLYSWGIFDKQTKRSFEGLPEMLSSSNKRVNDIPREAIHLVSIVTQTPFNEKSLEHLSKLLMYKCNELSEFKEAQNNYQIAKTKLRDFTQMIENEGHDADDLPKFIETLMAKQNKLQEQNDLEKLVKEYNEALIKKTTDLEATKKTLALQEEELQALRDKIKVLPSVSNTTS